MIFFALKVVRNGKVVKKYTSHSQRRFIKNLRTINWKDKGVKAYIKVDYGKRFYNDGVYENEKDLWFAFKAFIEKEQSCY
jgi:hypothetical protein